MNTSQKFQRAIATFFLLIFFPTLVPANLYASNNGPNAIEAASFEPVDAADMVNLATGDMSYVLPLLNVPSPEGGFPLALSYKAGVAMDQEASWVGMGWSLNPGAVNRFVNGYADDISIGLDHTFVYDKGQELDMYNIGVGASYYGITAGLGAYWGSNKTFGGSVTLGYGPAVGTFTAGTGGTGFNIGGYVSTEVFSTEFSMATFRKNGGATVQGPGVSNMNVSATQDDYNINVSEKGFNTGMGVYFYYGHRRVSYNLFKEYTGIYSGQLYIDAPWENSLSYYSSDLSKDFDTNNVVMTYGNMLDLLGTKKQMPGHDSFLLPSKDKFIVNAQGINGKISPVFTEEFGLTNSVVSYATGKYDERYHMNKPLAMAKDLDMKLNTKLFFEFEGQSSSFLRIDRGNVIRDLNAESTYSGSVTVDQKAVFAAKTNSSALYNENVTPEGYATKVGNRKRTGQYVQALTNEEILAGGSALNFIEAKNLDRTNQEIYAPKSIGGFKITAVDGKTYHYSLPVINFETWFKNFKEENDENGNFYENEKDEPYVTDWLLTAITGPDYVDANNDNKLDKEDYGYWVEMEYGKWSDGYIWQSNSGENNLVKGDMRNSDRYEFYKGRKQIYYLDAIKTRTHTAYFVKGLRQDAVGKEMQTFKERATSIGSFNKLTHSVNLSSNAYQSCRQESPNQNFWKIHPDMYNIPRTYQGTTIEDYKGFRQNFIYRDYPKHYSLKLEKIILVKNDGLSLDKAAGVDLVGQKEAFSSKTTRCFKVTVAVQAQYPPDDILDGVYTRSDNPLRKIDIHSSHNVLDVNDLEGVDFNENAVKVINFEFDDNYALRPNSNTSTAPNKGNLTLSKLDFLGKGGTKYLPKYEFSYKSPATPFNNSLEDDWGYHKNTPEAWSLSEIKSPLGDKVTIDYESDDYSNVGVVSSRLFAKGLKFAITKNTTTNKLEFKITRNTYTNDNVIEDFTNFRAYFSVSGKANIDMFICRRSKYGGSARAVELDLKNVIANVKEVTNDYAVLELDDNNAYWSFDDNDRSWILNRIYSLNDVKHLNGNSDGVIMRDAGERKCWSWRDSYDNDDVSFHYRMASSGTPIAANGGGLRVKAIRVLNGNQVMNEQKYFYNTTASGIEKNQGGYISSGSTAYVPFNYPVILPYASLLPSANVLYQNVLVQGYGSNGELLSKTQYQFNTFGDMTANPNSVFNLGDKLFIKKQQDETIPFNYQQNGKTRDNRVVFKKFKIENLLDQIGNLVSIKSFNKENQLLGSKKYNYKTNLDSDGTLGVSQESFMTKYSIPRDVTGSNITSADYFAVSVGDIKYPSTLVSVESQGGGQVVKTYFDKYDFLTGLPVETRTEIVGGKSYKTKSVPAYTKAAYAGMGSKHDNAANRNMLSQSSTEYSYIMDNGNWEETGVGITTWSNNWEYQDISGNLVTPSADKEKVWRKHKSFVWNGVKNEGIFQNYNETTDEGFNWTLGVGTQPANWKQVSEVTNYNHYSAVLEAKDMNDNYSSSKMGDKETKLVAEGNARYNELYYTGLENLSGNALEPGISLSGAYRDNSMAHSGKYCLAVNSPSKLNIDLKANQHKAGRYKLNVWVHKDNAGFARLMVNGVAVTTSFNGPSKQAGNWILKTHYFDLTTAATTISLNSKAGAIVYYDDIMLRPIASSVTGYVYNEKDELTHVVGNNGLATMFEYDSIGRMYKNYVEVFDDQANGITGGFKLSSEKKWKYKHL